MTVLIHKAYGTLKVLEDGSLNGNMRHKTEEEEDDNVYPSEELTDNIGSIEIRSWGDEPNGAYIVVEGMTEEAVKSHWQVVAEMLPLKELWGNGSEE